MLKSAYFQTLPWKVLRKCLNLARKVLENEIITIKSVETIFILSKLSAYSTSYQSDDIDCSSYLRRYPLFVYSLSGTGCDGNYAADAS